MPQHFENMIRSAVLALVFCSAFGSTVSAQDADTTRSFEMETIVVTADRAASTVSESTGAVSVLTAEALRELPGVTRLEEALRHIPGFAMLNLDGQGLDPQATVRGFYGGGETEYVLVLLDGRPLNNVEMGLVNWSQIPLSMIKSIEVIRGGASSLYGDAAVGGVMNIITNRGSQGGQVSFGGGSYNTYQVEGFWNTRVVNSDLSMHGGWMQTDGYRDHAQRRAGSLGLNWKRNKFVTVSGVGHYRQYDVPGPLTESQVALSPTQGSTLFRFDQVEEYDLSLAVRFDFFSSPTFSLGAEASYDIRLASIVRTLPLAASFASTKGRDVMGNRFYGSIQLMGADLLMDRDQLTMGLDVSVGLLGSEYHDIVTGSESDYTSHSGEWGEVSEKGYGNRAVAAGFLQYAIRPAKGTRLTLGGRYDLISDKFTDDMFMGEPVPEQDADEKASHLAFSPKVGISQTIIQSSNTFARVYLNFSRIFKVATLDQLFDQRVLPVPFPPFGIVISNRDLKPQRGRSFEGGVYSQRTFGSGMAVEFNGSAYRIDMRDELGFDFDTFSYANISSSLHQGFEGSLKVNWGESASLHANYTLQSVTYGEGNDEDNQVEGIPKDYFSAGVQFRPHRNMNVGAVMHYVDNIFLDSANQVSLDGYFTLDASMSFNFPRYGIGVKAEALNILNASYSTTGFPDPSGFEQSGVVFLYPAAGSSLRVGANITF